MHWFNISKPLLLHSGSLSAANPSCPGVRRQSHTVDKLPVYCRPQKDKRPFTLAFTPTDSLELPIRITCTLLACGRKLESWETAHADAGKT